MKKILSILALTGVVFFISSHATAQAVEKMPIRTSDPHPAVQRTTPVAMPIKDGGGGKTITSVRTGFERGAVKAILPPMRAGSAAGSSVNKTIPVSAGSAKLPIKGTGTAGTTNQ